MKVRITDKGNLRIDGETPEECAALKAWEDRFAEGESSFKIGDAEGILRADEDVAAGRHKPKKKKAKHK